jgi:hypothetical protein
MSLFQNPVGADLRSDGQALGKTGRESGFSPQFKVAVPKAEVLEQPRMAEKSKKQDFIPPLTSRRALTLRPL